MTATRELLTQLRHSLNLFYRLTGRRVNDYSIRLKAIDAGDAWLEGSDAPSPQAQESQG
jgi:hypothetical protein